MCDPAMGGQTVHHEEHSVIKSPSYDNQRVSAWYDIEVMRCFFIESGCKGFLGCFSISLLLSTLRLYLLQGL